MYAQRLAHTMKWFSFQASPSRCSRCSACSDRCSRDGFGLGSSSALSRARCSHSVCARGRARRARAVPAPFRLRARMGRRPAARKDQHSHVARARPSRRCRRLRLGSGRSGTSRRRRDGPGCPSGRADPDRRPRPARPSTRPPPPVAVPLEAAPQLHLPAGFFDDLVYSYWSTAGFPKTVNGAGGFDLIPYDRLRVMVSGFPDARRSRHCMRSVSGRYSFIPSGLRGLHGKALRAGRSQGCR